MPKYLWLEESGFHDEERSEPNFEELRLAMREIEEDSKFGKDPANE